VIAVSSINEGKIFTNLEMAFSRRIEHGSLTVSINMIDLATEFVQESNNPRFSLPNSVKKRCLGKDIFGGGLKLPPRYEILNYFESIVFILIQSGKEYCIVLCFFIYQVAWGYAYSILLFLDSFQVPLDNLFHKVFR
jgi:hypothetical protein